MLAFYKGKGHRLDLNSYRGISSMMPNTASAPTGARRTASSACVSWWSWLSHMPSMPPS